MPLCPAQLKSKLRFRPQQRQNRNIYSRKIHLGKRYLKMADGLIRTSLKQAVHLAKFSHSFQREFRHVRDCFKGHLAPQHFQDDVRFSLRHALCHALRHALCHALCLCFLCNVLCKIFHRFAHDPSPFLCFLKKSYPFCQYVIIHILGSCTATWQLLLVEILFLFLLYYEISSKEIWIRKVWERKRTSPEGEVLDCSLCNSDEITGAG